MQRVVAVEKLLRQDGGIRRKSLWGGRESARYRGDERDAKGATHDMQEDEAGSAADEKAVREPGGEEVRVVRLCCQEERLHRMSISGLSRHRHESMGSLTCKPLQEMHQPPCEDAKIVLRRPPGGFGTKNWSSR